MGPHGRLRWWAIAVAIAALLFPCAAGAEETGPAAAAVLARLAADPRIPDAYSADLELHVKLHVFPYLGLTLRGTSTYRRPGSYHFVLRGVPKMAGKLDDIHYEFGDPAAWPQQYDIAVSPDSTPAAPVVRLTPKKTGQVAYLDVQTDGGHVVRVVWMRHDGGTIVLTIAYAAAGASDVIAEQHAVVDIPHMRAELTARYSNVTLQAPTFAGVNDR